MGIIFLADRPARGLSRLAPISVEPVVAWGSCCTPHSSPRNILSDTQPESTHCHKHNEFLRESTEGSRGPPIPGRFLTNPCRLRPTPHPVTSPPCCSAPASGRPSGSGTGLPESFLSCAVYSGDSHTASHRTDGGLQGRASAQWRARASFLPSFLPWSQA